MYNALACLHNAAGFCLASYTLCSRCRSPWWFSELLWLCLSITRGD